jgi:hypothetical protein
MLESNREYIADALRATVAQIEVEHPLAPDDPTFMELKRIVFNRITEIESLRPPAAKSSQAEPLRNC